MKNDAANNRTVRQKLKRLKKTPNLFSLLVWQTLTRAAPFTLDDLCRIISIADIFRGVLLSTVTIPTYPNPNFELLAARSRK